MITHEMRSILKSKIDGADDQTIKKLFDVLKGEEKTESDLNATRRELIFQERENYLHNNTAGFDWEEVKSMALDKEKRNDLYA